MKHIDKVIAALAEAQTQAETHNDSVDELRVAVRVALDSMSALSERLETQYQEGDEASDPMDAQDIGWEVDAIASDLSEALVYFEKEHEDAEDDARSELDKEEMGRLIIGDTTFFPEAEEERRLGQ